MLEKYYSNFIDFMKSEKNCSKSTASSYWTDFYIFKEYLNTKKVTNLEDITTSILKEYVTYIKLKKGHYFTQVVDVRNY